MPYEDIWIPVVLVIGLAFTLWRSYQIFYTIRKLPKEEQQILDDGFVGMNVFYYVLFYIVALFGVIFFTVLNGPQNFGFFSSIPLMVLLLVFAYPVFIIGLYAILPTASASKQPAFVRFLSSLHASPSAIARPQVGFAILYAAVLGVTITAQLQKLNLLPFLQ